MSTSSKTIVSATLLSQQIKFCEESLNSIKLINKKHIEMIGINKFPEYQVPGAVQHQFNPYEYNGG